MAKSRILITGSSGMLGVDLSKELRKTYDLFGADILKANRSNIRDQKYFNCDIADRKQIAAVMGKIRPDMVVHTAAWTDVDGCEFDRNRAYRINTIGAKNVALACKSSGAKLIYISTDYVFDGKKKKPYTESDETNPLSVYADSKLKGEAAVRKALREYFILRTGWLYGKYGKNFVDTIAAKAKIDGTLKVVDDQVGSPTYTVDLAKAMRALINSTVQYSGFRAEDYGIYHVSNAGSVSWYQYAKAIVKILGIRTKILPISSKELDRPARRPAMSAMDSSKFENITGYRMRGWKNALLEYLG